MKKILPPRLDSNKLIGIIAPADPVAGVCSKDTIKRGYAYLKSKGFSVIEGRSVKELTHKHTAGSIALRIADIHNFLKNKAVGCIMAFWGGFNTNQLLEHLDYELIKKHPKIIIGYSDMTALTTAITAKTGLVTFSGPAAISFAKPAPFEYTWDYFEKACIKAVDAITVESAPEYADDFYFLRKDNNRRIRKINEGIKIFVNGKARGEVVAGNLQSLLILNGTSYMPSLKDKILFIEEDETSTPAHVDRFLCQCRQLGWFNEIAGLVFGRFTEHSGFSAADPFEDLLNAYFPRAKFPILYNVDFGHSDPLITIPNGGMCTLDGDAIVFDRAVSGA